MSDALIALATGAAVGIIFALVKLPPPAPQTLPGVLGIVGIVGAWALASRGLS